MTTFIDDGIEDLQCVRMDNIDKALKPLGFEFMPDGGVCDDYCWQNRKLKLIASFRLSSRDPDWIRVRIMDGDGNTLRTLEDRKNKTYSYPEVIGIIGQLVLKHSKTPPPHKLTDSYITEVCPRSSVLGSVLYIKVQRHDGRPMGWEEIYARFIDAYPGRWAVQVFPEEAACINEANMYHLFVMDEGEVPRGLTIR
jgi:hypothetical protein